MAFGVVDQLGRRVKAHGLGIEQSRQKAGGFVAFEPAAHVGQQRKTGGVALGKAVFAKALNLLEDGLGKRFVIAVFDHLVHQPVMKLVHAALALPGSHGAAQVVGFITGEVGCNHGNLHHLLLKNRDAQGAPQGLTQRWIRVDHVIRALAVFKVRVHHAALNRAGPHNGHFNHQIVKRAGFQARQHAHLRAALNLEHAHGVGIADHLVSGRVFGRDVLHAQRRAALLAHQVKTAADGAEHA